MILFLSTTILSGSARAELPPGLWFNTGNNLVSFGALSEDPSPSGVFGPTLENLQLIKGERSILVRIEDETLVGYAVVLTAVSSEDEEDEFDFLYAYVSELMVTQRYRGRGIGANLLARCEELAREAGVQWMRVTVLTANAESVRAYERAGFGSLLTVMEKPLSS